MRLELVTTERPGEEPSLVLAGGSRSDDPGAGQGCLSRSAWPRRQSPMASYRVNASLARRRRPSTTTGCGDTEPASRSGRAPRTRARARHEQDGVGSVDGTASNESTRTRSTPAHRSPCDVAVGRARSGVAR